MNEVTNEPTSQIHLARAVRFGFTAIVVGMSYPNIRLATHIPFFEQIFRDMVGNKSLPLITALTIRFQMALIVSSVAIALAAIIVPFFTASSRSIYVAGFLILAVLAQLFFTWHAMMNPLFTIISAIQSGSPP
jgi:hypothetical protein